MGPCHPWPVGQADTMYEYLVIGEQFTNHNRQKSIKSISTTCIFNDTCRMPREARAAEHTPKGSLLDTHPAGDRRVPLALTLMSNLWAQSQKAFSSTVLGSAAQSRFAVESLGLGFPEFRFVRRNLQNLRIHDD
jgi:hypothetical protein